MLMLRNLVTSLFEHERIKTTLPKARDVARLAEKVITMGKKGTAGSHSQASAFLLKPVALTNLLETYAKRYSERPGGYTRVLKLGNRKGDHAPAAILELVDNPQDMRWEMTARAVGWDIVNKQLGNEGLGALMTKGAQNTEATIQAARDGQPGALRPKTAWNVQKLLKYRGAESLSELGQKAKEHADRLIATPLAMKTLYETKKAKDHRNTAPRPYAGKKHVGDSRSVLDLSRGRLGHQRTRPTKVLTMQSAFGKYKQTAHP